MEKLIELLNEYDENRKIGKNGLYKWEEYDPREEYIISKNFGFIKWLVENDEISYKKLLENSNFIEIKSIGWGIAYSLTMLLAIQDEPIVFLISILK